MTSVSMQRPPPPHGSWMLLLDERNLWHAGWPSVSRPFNEGRPTIKSKLSANYRDVDIRGSLNGEWRALG